MVQLSTGVRRSWGRRLSTTLRAHWAAFHSEAATPTQALLRCKLHPTSADVWRSCHAQVYTLGGSVTRGLGASKPEFNYANRLFALINATFPHP